MLFVCSFVELITKFGSRVSRAQAKNRLKPRRNKVRKINPQVKALCATHWIAFLYALDPGAMLFVCSFVELITKFGSRVSRAQGLKMA